MRESEVNHLLNEIEHELAQVNLQDEAALHVIQTQIEQEEMLNRLLITCKICQNQNTEGIICPNCAVDLQNDEYSK